MTSVDHRRPVGHGRARHDRPRRRRGWRASTCRLCVSVDGVAPFGACRLCTVEITKRGRSRLVASCCYPAEEGLDVPTESEKVVKGGKLVLEMLLARAPGTQALQEYGKRYGAQVDKFSPDPSHCILCGLCVNYCAEVKGKHAIGFVERGWSGRSCPARRGRGGVPSNAGPVSRCARPGCGPRTTASRECPTSADMAVERLRRRRSAAEPPPPKAGRGLVSRSSVQPAGRPSRWSTAVCRAPTTTSPTGAVWRCGTRIGGRFGCDP